MESSPHFFTKRVLCKVPAVTAYFWIIKILATTVGETAADFLNVNLHLGLNGTSIVTAFALAIVLAIQIKANKYIPFLYWLTVVLISIVGTLITDNLVDNLGVSLELSTLIFSICLTITFLVWFYNENTLSIHTIFTRKREVFYWLAILFTFALGTAAGDLLSEGFAFGYLNSLFIFLALIGSVTIAYYKFHANPIASFWLAYILTRPLGASAGDLLSQSHIHGGLGFGTVTTSFLFLSTILLLVIYLTITRKDVIELVEAHYQ